MEGVVMIDVNFSRLAAPFLDVCSPLIDFIKNDILIVHLLLCSILSNPPQRLN